MPCIYSLKIKMHHMFRRNHGPSILQKFCKLICNVFCTLISTYHDLPKKIRNIFWQYGRIINPENNDLLLNLKQYIQQFLASYTVVYAVCTKNH